MNSELISYELGKNNSVKLDQVRGLIIKTFL